MNINVCVIHESPQLEAFHTISILLLFCMDDKCWMAAHLEYGLPYKLVFASSFPFLP